MGLLRDVHHHHTAAPNYPQTVTHQHSSTADDARLYKEVREQVLKDIDEVVPVEGNVLGSITSYKDGNHDDSFVLFTLNGSPHRIRLSGQRVRYETMGVTKERAARAVVEMIAQHIIIELDTTIGLENINK